MRCTGSWRTRLTCVAQVVHARIAMLAALGWVVQERWHPLFGGDIEGERRTNAVLAWLRDQRFGC